VPLHPLYKAIGPLLDDFILEQPFLKNCAPFVLALRYLIPSADYSTHPPPPALPLYIRSRLRVTPTPPQPSTPSEPSPATSKSGADIFSNSMNVTREAMEATGHAFVAIGASMNVRKWSWPGYLTFKGAPLKTVRQDEPDSSEEKPDGEMVADSVPSELVSPHPEAGLRGEVDRESLHEAMSTDGKESFQENAPLQEENAPATETETETAVDSTSQPEEATAIEAVTLPTASGYAHDEHDPSPPASPSTPIIHPPDLTSPPSLSSSQSTLPVSVPPPSFRSFSLHFSPSEDPLATVPRRVLYIIVSEYFDAKSC
jgi:hypothetical protein